MWESEGRRRVRNGGERGMGENVGWGRVRDGRERGTGSLLSPTLIRTTEESEGQCRVRNGRD